MDDNAMPSQSPTVQFVKIHIECYGPASRWCGADRLILEQAEGASIADIFSELAARYPEFAARRGSIAVALDDAIVSTTTLLAEDCRVALIPPVSGG